VNKLKQAKQTYLEAKKNHQSLRDEYAQNEKERKRIKMQRYQEKQKMKWVRLRKSFGKKKLKSIKAMKYVRDGCMIRTSNKLEIENVIMSENA